MSVARSRRVQSNHAANSAATPGGAGLNQLHIRAMNTLREVETMVHPGGATRPPALGPASLEAKMSELDSALATMEQLIPTERRPQKRDIWKKKLESLRHRCALLRTEADRRRRGMNRRAFEEQQRQELFGDMSREDHVINMSMADQHDSLMRSTQMTDDLLSLGKTTLGSLSGQRKMLKGAHRKLLDMANKLGLSGSLLRLIEKREWVDAVITYGCMIFTLIFLYGLWRYVGSSS